MKKGEIYISVEIDGLYKLMCARADELQKAWVPSRGDWIIVKSSYCNKPDICSEDFLCKKCIEMDNIYVVSEHFDYAESVGGRHIFYGGGLCIRGKGIFCNETQCFVASENENRKELANYNKNLLKDFLWIPTLIQLEGACRKEFNPDGRGLQYLECYDRLNNWVSVMTEAYPHISKLSIGALWLSFLMFDAFGKIWSFDDSEWISY